MPAHPLQQVALVRSSVVATIRSLGLVSPFMVINWSVYRKADLLACAVATIAAVNAVNDLCAIG
jgi:hypothetical protein